MKAVLICGLLALGSAVYAAEDKIDEQLLSRFDPRILNDRGSIPYRLFNPPQYDPQQKYPLIFFLHGGVGVGTDDRRQFNGGNEMPPKGNTSPNVQAKKPCFFFAPQFPPDPAWALVLRTHPSGALRLS